MKSKFVQELSAQEMRETNGGFLCCIIIKLAILCAILKPGCGGNGGEEPSTPQGPGDLGGGEE